MIKRFFTRLKYEGKEAIKRSGKYAYSSGIHMYNKVKMIITFTVMALGLIVLLLLIILIKIL